MKKKISVVVIIVVVITLIGILGGVFNVKTIEVQFKNKPDGIAVSDVLAKSGLELRRSILNLNENEVTKKINHAYPDRSIEVVDIERKFPNKIILTVLGRTPICYVKDEDSNVYLADADFQLERKIAKTNVKEGDTKNLIAIEGYELSAQAANYDNDVLKKVRMIFLSFTRYWSYDAQRAIIKSIKYDGGKYVVESRSGEKTNIGENYNKSEIDSNIQDFYNRYLMTQGYKKG